MTSPIAPNRIARIRGPLIRCFLREPAAPPDCKTHRAEVGHRAVRISERRHPKRRNPPPPKLPPIRLAPAAATAAEVDFQRSPPALRPVSEPLASAGHVRRA